MTDVLPLKILNILSDHNECYTGQDIVDTLEEEGYEVVKKNKWEPINTAPKDGTKILVTCSGEDDLTDIVEWISSYPGWYNGECVYDDDLFTHWMPLSKSPKKE